MQARVTLFLLLLAITIPSWGIMTTIYDNGATQAIPNLGVDLNVPNQKDIDGTIASQKSKLDNPKFEINGLLTPNKSEFTPGTVGKYKLEHPEYFKTPIFVIGGDQESIEWAKQNSVYLKKINAIGMVTNVGSAQDIQDLEDKTGLSPLIPANMQGLSSLVGTTHYPFLIQDGWVLQ